MSAMCPSLGLIRRARALGYRMLMLWVIFIGSSGFLFAQAIPDSDERWDSGFYASFGCNGAVLAVSQGPGSTVFLGGQFTSCANVPTRYIAAYDTATKTFSVLDDGLASGMGGEVRALFWTNDRLYVGSLFTTAGGISASGMAAWVPDTQTWHALGDGLAHSSAFSLQVRAFELFNNELVVAGSFTQAGGQTANNIAKVTLDLANPIWSVLSDENRQGTWFLPKSNCPELSQPSKV